MQSEWIHNSSQNFTLSLRFLALKDSLLFRPVRYWLQIKWIFTGTKIWGDGGQPILPPEISGYINSWKRRSFILCHLLVDWELFAPLESWTIVGNLCYIYTYIEGFAPTFIWNWSIHQYHLFGLHILASFERLVNFFDSKFYHNIPL